MKYRNWKELAREAENSIPFKIESILVEFIADICEAMKKTNTSKKELAKKMNCSPANITRIMKCPDNITLETMVRLSDVLGLTLVVTAGEGTAIGPEPRKNNPCRPSNWGANLRSISQETISEISIAA